MAVGLFCVVLFCLSWGTARASDAVIAALDAALNEVRVPTGPYKVGPGDVLNIRVYDEDDLNTKVTVSDAGTIQFPLVGDLYVVDLQVDDIVRMLESGLMARFLVDPHVTVEIVDYASRPVQVLGAVNDPGVFFLQGPTTLLEMLAMAGGVDSNKFVHEVQVRRFEKGMESATSVPMDWLVRGDTNMELRAGDLVFVPEGEILYVSGKVGMPGRVSFREGLTITQALSEAGGTTEGARLREVHLLRGGRSIPVNLRRIQQGKDADLLVQPEDQIFVAEMIF
ncbi:MAG: SLBB domain-containing protein [Myxococcota bacterium]|nr:SLBB domain-containing protein [Myxococcota bacterium]